MRLNFPQLCAIESNFPSLPGADEIDIFFVPITDLAKMYKSGYSRTLAKQILSHYLHLNANSIILEENALGKPYLASPQLDTPVYFNLSHTQGYLVFALSSSAPLGIDIERTDRAVKLPSIARRFFHPSEMFDDKRNDSKHFLRLWTLKEAFLKGLGVGLTVSPSSFYIKKIGENTYCALSDDKLLNKSYESWTLLEVPAPDGYVCSLAYQNI